MIVKIERKLFPQLLIPQLHSFFWDTLYIYRRCISFHKSLTYSKVLIGPLSPVLELWQHFLLSSTKTRKHRAVGSYLKCFVIINPIPFGLILSNIVRGGVPSPHPMILPLGLWYMFLVQLFRVFKRSLKKLYL